MIREKESFNKTILDKFMNKTYFLPKEEQLVLVLNAQKGDIKSRHRLIESNLRLITHEARRLRGANISFDDLVAEGVIGMDHAIDAFDPKFGASFSTYCIWMVRSHMFRSIYSEANMIKIPIRAYQLTRKHSALVAEGKKYEDAAIEVGLTKKNIDKLSKCDVLSIEGISEESDNDVKDDRTNVEGSFIKKTMRESVRKCLEKNLDARTYELMCYRYGLGGKPQCTLRRTGALLGLSPERVRQIQRSTEIKLKACTELRDLYA